ncbi:MAG: hypothetical protein Q6368_006445 [Candidatus Baldrarchaeota archaeon]
MGKTCLTFILDALKCAIEKDDKLIVKVVSEAALNYSIIFRDEKARKYSEEIYRKYSEDVEVEELLAAEKEFKKDYYLLPAIYISLKSLDRGDKNTFRIVKLLLDAADCLVGEKRFDISKIREGEISKDILRIYYEVEKQLFGEEVHSVSFEKMWHIIVKVGKTPKMEDITTIDFIYETMKKLEAKNIHGEELEKALMMIIDSLYKSEEVKKLAKTIIQIENKTQS